METEQKTNLHDSGQLGELYKALALAQIEMTNAEKNSANPFHKSNYADLTSCMNAARPHLAKNGLCVIQQIVAEGDVSFLVTRLGHLSGQWIESKERIRPKDNTIQAYGSTLTYLRRYSYCALVGVAPSGDDDDGERAMSRAPSPQALKARPVTPVIDYISDSQCEEILDMIAGDDELLAKVLQKGKITDLKLLEKSRFDGLMQFIDREKEIAL